MFKATTVTMAVLLSAATVALAAAPAVDVNPGQIKVETQDREAKRRKPRIPGGSGCDSPHDLIEHPECRANNASAVEQGEAQPVIEARRKPRIPGGSGCDSPHDLIEHPECRANNASAVEQGEDRPVIEARRKPRVPGGSGCDSPHDRVEHPECRV